MLVFGDGSTVSWFYRDFDALFAAIVATAVLGEEGNRVRLPFVGNGWMSFGARATDLWGSSSDCCVL